MAIDPILVSLTIVYNIYDEELELSADGWDGITVFISCEEDQSSYGWKEDKRRLGGN